MSATTVDHSETIKHIVDVLVQNIEDTKNEIRELQEKLNHLRQDLVKVQRECKHRDPLKMLPPNSATPHRQISVCRTCGYQFGLPKGEEGAWEH